MKPQWILRIGTGGAYRGVAVWGVNHQHTAGTAHLMTGSFHPETLSFVPFISFTFNTHVL